MKSAVTRRIIWAVAIGIVLVGIVVGILTFVDLNAVTDSLKRCAPSIWKSRWPNYLGCTMGAHEGLAGGLIGAAGALFAAWLAFDAIQEQLAEERERLHRQQVEAKAVAVASITEPIDGAAKYLQLIEIALGAAESEQDRMLPLMTEYAQHIRMVLETFMVRESVRGLGVDDRILYLTIVTNLSIFVNFSTRPFEAFNTKVRLEMQKQMLTDIHNEVLKFDVELAEKFTQGRKDGDELARDRPITPNADHIPKPH
jgi:hypothetical protein